MQLKIKNGSLSLGSIYKLFVIAWFTSWVTLFGSVSTLILISVLITGEIHVNGDVISGRMSSILAIAPMFVLFPIIIGIQSLFFAGFLTSGVWLYRLKRPVIIVTEDKIF